MLHHMQLNAEPFAMIQNGSKTIELRLYDEKRQSVQAGDYIAFTQTECPSETIQTRVIALHRFDRFAALYENLPLLQCGYTAENVSGASPADMEQYYSREKQAQYGVVGIELRMTELQRFLDAQNNGWQGNSDYTTAMHEIQAGEKKTHWMWYVFPELQGLQKYDKATEYFAIRDLQEAQDYYAHPLLGQRLLAITQALLVLPMDDPMRIFGYIDAFKFRACMTLFHAAAPGEQLFTAALNQYCMGMPDEETLELLRNAGL